MRSFTEQVLASVRPRGGGPRSSSKTASAQLTHHDFDQLCKIAMKYDVKPGMFLEGIVVEALKVLSEESES